MFKQTKKYILQDLKTYPALSSLDKETKFRETEGT
jgi:hypothetical protein